MRACEQENKLTLAVDIGGSHATIALVGGEGIAAEKTITSDPREGLRALLPRIELAFRELLEAEDCSLSDCHGIGLAFPAVVNTAEARVVSAPRGKYEDAPDIDLPRWAKESFGLPLLLEGDGHSACLGEWFHGAAKGLTDFVYVTLGTGYGSSVVMGGYALRGKSYLAGALGGHLTVKTGPEGNQCICRHRGCAEAETGTWALEGLVRAHPDFHESKLNDCEQINYRNLFALKEEGDALATHFVNRNLSLWGASLVNLIHAYDPEKIVIGGGIMKAADQILPVLNDYIKENAWVVGEPPQVVLGKFYNHAALFGIRSLFTEKIVTL